MNKNIINNAQLLEIKTKIRQLGAMMNAYPFNEETESFIRKKFDMPIPDESKEQ